jgi:predicted DNA-binding protein (UPF0251 family)
MFEKKLKKEWLDTILIMLQDDTISNVASVFKVSPRTLQRYLKASKNYIPRNYNPNPYIKLDIVEILRLRSEHMPIRRIANRYGVCPATIFNAIQRAIHDQGLTRDLLIL